MFKYILSIIFLFYTVHLNADIIKGKVFGMDENKKIPLNKATIKWLNSSIGTFSNEKGEFNINTIKTTNKLIVSYAGYKIDTIEATNGMEINLIPGLELNEINVIGQAKEATISNSSIIKTFSISERGLRKAACCNLAESFVTNAAADVEYSDAVSGARQIKLLGLEGIYNQLLTENIPSMRGIAGIYGLGYIPGTWMKSIAISKGTASVLNGFEGISGQINVEYKKPEDYRPLFFNFFADQFGRLEMNTDYSVKLSEKLSTMSFFHANLNKFVHDQNQDLFADNPSLYQINFFNRWKYHGESMESVSGLQVLYEDRTAGQMDFIKNNDNNLYGINVKTSRAQFFTKNGFFIGDEMNSIGTIVSATYHNHNSKYGKRIFDANQLSVYGNVFFDYYFKLTEDDHDRHDHDGHDHDGHDHSSHETESHNDEHQEENTTSNLKIGGSFQSDIFDQKFENYNEKIEEYIPGIFSELTIPLINSLTLTTGARIDFHNIHGAFFTPRVHLKYNINDLNTIRLSAGKGSRTSYPLADYSSLLVSSRDVIFKEQLKREEALNLGASYTSDFILFDIPITLNLDYYRTDFINQIVADFETNSDRVVFSNLNGKSYSNSFQIDVLSEPFDFLSLTTAYRYNDVKITYQDEIVQKPLQSPHKYLINFAFSNRQKSWILDFTVNYNSGGKLPNTEINPEQYRLPKEFDGFITVYSQITRKFDGWEIYLGGENLTDFIQNRPILAYDNPFGSHFDSSIIYGPTMGRVIYLGIRISNDI